MIVMGDIEVKIPTPAVDAFNSLSTDGTFVERMVMWGQSIGLAFWNRPLVATLVALIGIDVATGFLKAIISRTGSSKFSFESHVKKVQMLMSVVFGMVVDLLMPFPVPPMTWASTIAAMHCYTECWSILENLDASGVPLPDILRNTIQQARQKKIADAEAAAPRVEMHTHARNITLVDTANPEAKTTIVMESPDAEQGERGEKGDKGDTGQQGEQGEPGRDHP